MALMLLRVILTSLYLPVQVASSSDVIQLEIGHVELVNFRVVQYQSLMNLPDTMTEIVSCVSTAPGRLDAINPLAANVVSIHGQTHDNEHRGFANTGPTQGADAMVQQERIQDWREEISHERLEAPRRERKEFGSGCAGLALFCAMMRTSGCLELPSEHQ